MANLRVDKITSTETFETTGSVQFVRTPSSRLTTDLGSGLNDNFTIEFWILASGIVSGSNSPGMFQLSDTSGGFKTSSVTLAMYWSTGQNMLGIYDSGGDSNLVPEDSNENDVWKHYAMVRNDGVLKVYRNGEEVYSAVNSNNYTSDRYLVIGGYWSTSYVWQGHISNFRILNNKALYTENFKPPMRELEVTPETVLLACQSKTDATHEKTGKTITVAGNAIANELTPGILAPVPKAGSSSAITGSVEFDGTGDYLTIPNTTDLRLADSDFTIEFWATISKVNSTYSVFALFENSSALRSYQLEVRSNGAVRFEWWYNGSSSNHITTGTGAVIVNEWYHYAVSRNGATLKLFINGVEIGSSDVGTNSFFNNTVTPFIIGGMFQSGAHEQRWQGNISNLRIVKGTALYTDKFIPPTRELKKVPGTVLLCCQDPDNPLTEATGKTITGNGDLQRADGVELITNGTFNSDVSNWTATDCTLTYSSGQMQITRSGGGGLTANQAFTTVAGNKYNLSGRINSSGSRGDLRVYNGSGTGGSMIVNLSGTGGAVTYLRGTFIASSTTSTVVIAIDNNGTSITVDNISVTLAEGSNKGSNFTPQVGDNRKVTFEGVTKINTENYFYLPTGDTVTRDSRSGRGIFGGGLGAPSPANLNLIDYVSISSMGNAFDFGDLTAVRRAVTGLGNQTRGIITGGTNSAIVNTIEFLTIATTGNTQTFGELTDERRGAGACASNTRGIIAGGRDNDSPSNKLNTVDYITIASTGNATSFGELNFKSVLQAGVSSPTRGVFGGGYTPTPITSIDFITIASIGNGTDFGDLMTARYGLGGAASPVRGVFAGGYVPGGYTNVMDYIIMASTGNAQDFGDLFVVQGLCSGASNGSRGIFAGGNSPARTNNIQYVTISTTGDAQDFGDLIEDREQLAGLSDSHGGLG